MEYISARHIYVVLNAGFSTSIHTELRNAVAISSLKTAVDHECMQLTRSYMSMNNSFMWTSRG